MSGLISLAEGLGIIVVAYAIIMGFFWLMDFLDDIFG